jgi:ornithine cyclodeaminase/alanine dehydrogenase-like protein (mu-crystallin family)
VLPIFPFHLDGEPCNWFDDALCHQQLTGAPVAYLDALQADLQSIADGELAMALPRKQIFSDSDYPCRFSNAGKGDFRVMPCIVSGPGRITKTVKIVGSNWRRKVVRQRMTVGRALYLDPLENFVHSEFAAFALSSARTGACAAIAHRLLHGGRSLTIFGAGPVAWYAVFYLASDRRIERLRLIDPDADKARRTLNALRQQFPHLLGESCATPAAIDDSETVILATDSQAPFFSPAMTKANLVISLGADSDEQSELHAEWIGQAELITDLEDSALIGDLKRWQGNGLLAGRATSDLLALLRQPNRPRADQERIVFVSTGSALLDNLTIHYLLEKAATQASSGSSETKSSNLPLPAGVSDSA